MRFIFSRCSISKQRDIEDETERFRNQDDNDVPSEEEYLRRQSSNKIKKNIAMNEREIEEEEERIERYLGRMDSQDINILRKSITLEGNGGERKIAPDEIPEQFDDMDSPEKEYTVTSVETADKRRKVIKARPISGISATSKGGKQQTFANSPAELPQHLFDANETGKVLQENPHTKKLASNPFKKPLVTTPHEKKTDSSITEQSSKIIEHESSTKVLSTN